ncbi:nitrate- and nitrite sensing domain-containing protein [Micromonospora sp. NPDC050417]|uniref:sensor histidine kinase n=1 Tax=Micromonospora sp. NPDC050417 TaxID=3364280 RepID=UPI00378B1A6A
MLLSRLRIRGKLAVLIIIPLFSMGALAVPVVVDRVDTASRAGQTATAVRTAGLVDTVAQDLQEERLLSVGYLLGVADRVALTRQSTTVTDRIGDLRAKLGDDLPGPVANALDGVRKLADTRAAVLAHRATTDEIMTAFEGAIEGLIDSSALLYNADTATRAGRQLVALDAALRTDEQISTSGTLIVVVVASQSPSASMRYIASMSELQVMLTRFHAFATPEQSQLHRMINTAAIARTGKDFLTLGAVNPTTAVNGLSVATVFPAVTSLGTLGHLVKKKIVADILTDVTDQQQRALTTAYVVGSLVLLVLIVVVALSIVVARTVARPLTRLTGSAERVARLTEAELVRIVDDETESSRPIRLDPVEVGAHDEIGDLARAFDRVQRMAAELVERQAASRRNVAQMFGHVGRRTQNLVGRQIALIDQLEQRETDPTRLQHLYRLDHVSSRLRRNASSLVVLSGSAGSDGHVAPLPLSDVARLALGEIEDYTRVDVQVQSDLLLAPAAIGDLALTLAELMENATTFSPPHTRVMISSQTTPDGVRITLSDHGIGMPPERLAEENARLTRRERLDLAPTELLGLFVVGRLARRHGWRVVLSGTPGGGVTANLDLDSHLLVTTPTGPHPAAPRSLGSGPTPLALAAGPAISSRSMTEPASSGHADRSGADPHRLLPGSLALDPTVLNRARHTITAGTSWNAFAPPLRPVSTTAEPVSDGRPTETVPETVPAAPARSIRQRVPGAQLPMTSPTPPGPIDGDSIDPGRHVGDPAAARALMEEFEFGVRQAQAAPPIAPIAAGPVTTPPGPAVSQLTRRVPGANLDIPDPAPRYDHIGRPPEDPDEVRRQMMQFEAGVDRALRQVSPIHRHEEGSSR